MSQIGTAAGRKVGKLAEARALDAQFAEADAREQDRQAEVLARFDSAVVAAAAAYGDTIKAARRRRLALILKHFYFCGAAKREGSTMRIETLRKKLGTLAVSTRQIKQDLQLLTLWEFFHAPRRKLRGMSRRLNAAAIDAMIIARRAAAQTSPLKTVASPMGLQTSPLGRAKFPSPLENFPTEARKLPPENKSASFNSAAKRGGQLSAISVPPAAAVAVGLTWSELAELLGEDEEGLEGLMREALTPNRWRMASDYRRDGKPLPSWLTDPVLEAVS